MPILSSNGFQTQSILKIQIHIFDSLSKSVLRFDFSFSLLVYMQHRVTSQGTTTIFQYMPIGYKLVLPVIDMQFIFQFSD